LCTSVNSTHSTSICYSAWCHFIPSRGRCCLQSKRRILLQFIDEYANCKDKHNMIMIMIGPDRTSNGNSVRELWRNDILRLLFQRPRRS
jgi:hypothetical protein